jgi:hypothetical protein
MTALRPARRAPALLPNPNTSGVRGQRPRLRRTADAGQTAEEMR